MEYLKIWETGIISAKDQHEIAVRFLERGDTETALYGFREVYAIIGYTWSLCGRDLNRVLNLKKSYRRFVMKKYGVSI